MVGNSFYKKLYTFIFRKTAVRKAIEKGLAPRVPLKISRRGILDYNKPGWCSGYVNMLAKILFNLNYARGHAWTLFEKNNVVFSLLERTKDGELKPKKNFFARF
ncbi:MAG: hypothetical protein QXZ13_03105 [Candidatus Diapherotrites archaeon]